MATRAEDLVRIGTWDTGRSLDPRREARNPALARAAGLCLRVRGGGEPWAGAVVLALFVALLVVLVAGVAAPAGRLQALVAADRAAAARATPPAAPTTATATRP